MDASHVDLQGAGKPYCRVNNTLPSWLSPVVAGVLAGQVLHNMTIICNFDVFGGIGIALLLQPCGLTGHVTTPASTAPSQADRAGERALPVSFE
jgi:hypothetical protein